MEYAQESFIITEQQAFRYVLTCDDLIGIIRLSNFKPTKSGKTRITKRCIPIDAATKDKFHNSRTGWADRKNGDAFTGSYVSKQSNPTIYDYWEKYMYTKYTKLKQLEIAKSNES